MNQIHLVCPHCDKVNRVPGDRELKKAVCGHCKGSLLDTAPLDVNENRFGQHVANNDIPVVVDFYADWCGPCKMMAPVFHQVAGLFPGRARFLKVNTEREQMLAGRFGIRSIPTLMIFKGGNLADQMAGALDGPNLRLWVEKYV